MKTVPSTETENKALVRPSNQREALLEKISSLKTHNMTAKELSRFDIFVDRESRLFIQLCWSKLGVSREQLKNLEKDELNELATVIYEKTKLPALIHAGILLWIPIIGWLSLSLSKEAGSMPTGDFGSYANLKNLRYFWWYRQIKKMSSTDFKPNVSVDKERGVS